MARSFLTVRIPTATVALGACVTAKKRATKAASTEGNKPHEGKKIHSLPFFVTFVAFCRKMAFCLPPVGTSRHHAGASRPRRWLTTTKKAKQKDCGLTAGNRGNRAED